MSSGKKNPDHFHLKFNMNDPRQRQAAKILEQWGRRKAERLTDLILKYTNEEGEVENYEIMGKEPIEKKKDSNIEQILKNMNFFKR